MKQDFTCKIICNENIIQLIFDNIAPPTDVSFDPDDGFLLALKQWIEDKGIDTSL